MALTKLQPDLLQPLTGAQLPNPSSSTLGGIQSIAAVTSQWIRSISTSGVPALSQPAFSDISGSATQAQVTNLVSDLAAKAPLASPTFTGTVTIPTPFTVSAVSVTTTGTQLNYLAAATGTTGTTSTNVVFSTSPTLVTPVLGAATGTSLSVSGQLTSTVSTGTAPLVVSSTTRVSNLNAATAGNSDTVTTNANLTGDVTSSGNAATIAANAVTNAKAAQMATATFKGRTSSGTGNAEDLTVAQAQAMLSGTTLAKGFAQYSNTAGVFVSSNLLLYENALSSPIQTTDATVTALHTLAIATSSTVLIEIRVVARRTGGASGASGDGLVYSGAVKAKNIAGTVTLGTLQDGYSSKEQAGWAVTVVVSSTDVVIKGTGAAANNVDWHYSTLVRAIT